jgi:hypothetical protein
MDLLYVTDPIFIFMETAVDLVTHCFEETGSSRLSTLQELREKLREKLNETELQETLATLVKRGDLIYLGISKCPSEAYFMKYKLKSNDKTAIESPSTKKVKSTSMIGEGSPRLPLKTITMLSPMSRIKSRNKISPLQVDPELKRLEQQYAALKRHQTELIALVRKLRVLKQYRAKVKKIYIH